MTKEEFKKILKKTTFWDTDFKKLDVDKDKNYIIRRLAERGTGQEFLAMLQYYTKEDILFVINNFRGIPKKSKSFINLILK
jgi:hypothetical protein